ncbi:MAG: response regulator transcription factor [Sulfurospirillaceae bacterium]|nr:response regulator transcription factor [Sulfurospirillaceae bacterium]
MNKIVLEKLSSMSILYVEDDVLTHTVIANALSRYCHQLFSAYDGEEALMIHQTNPIDMYIVDISLPKMNGLSLIRHIRKDQKKVPIIITSAHTDQEYLLEALTYTLEHYLVKPFEFEILMDVIAQYIAKEYQLDNTLMIDEHTILDVTMKRLLIDNQPIALEPKEFACLELLCRNINKVLHYELIERYIYREEVMSRSAIRTLISNLNKKLAQKRIRNVSGEGYMFFMAQL